MASTTPVVMTSEEHDAVIALENLPLTTLMKTLADLTSQEREMTKSLNVVKTDADKVEAIVIKRMISADVHSQTVVMPNGQKMKFTISTKTYPSMVSGSRAASQALEAYARRLRSEGQSVMADAIEEMLTIKGSALAPMLNEWMLNESDLPPEFTGAIEASTKFSLSKTSAR